MTTPIEIPDEAIEAAAKAMHAWRHFTNADGLITWKRVTPQAKARYLKDAQEALRAAVEQVGWMDPTMEVLVKDDEAEFRCVGMVYDGCIPSQGDKPVFVFRGSDR